MAKNIFIQTSDATTGELDLSDNGHTWAGKGEVIQWHVMQSSGVKEITAITPKLISQDIWLRQPGKQGNHWEGEIKPKVGWFSTYRYTIHWVTANGTPRTHDPIISIRPTLLAFILKIIFILAGFLFGLFTFKFLWDKKSKKLS